MVDAGARPTAAAGDGWDPGLVLCGLDSLGPEWDFDPSAMGSAHRHVQRRAMWPEDRKPRLSPLVIVKLEAKG